MPVDLGLDDYKTVLESLPAGVYVVDLDRRILFWNDGAERITGYLRHEAIGRRCADGLLEHCDENGALLCGDRCPLEETMRDAGRRQVDVFLRHKDGQRVPVRVQAVPLRDEQGVVIGATECFEERELLPGGAVDVHRFGMHHLIHSAAELPDRKKIVACLEEEIADFRESPVPFGVLCIRVDELEAVRRTAGQRAVEGVMSMVARTLAANLGPNDLVGRWSDDCFVAIVKNCASEILVRFAGLLKRLARAAAIPWWGDRLSVTVSMGGSLVRGGDTPETLFHRAETNLATAAAAGGDRVAVTD